MKAQIKSVLVFVADLTGSGRFHKRGDAVVKVIPPAAFLQQADIALGFDGELLEWIDQHGIAPRFEEFSNGDEWRDFLRREFPGRELLFRHCRTETTGYNLVVVTE